MKRWLLLSLALFAMTALARADKDDPEPPGADSFRKLAGTYQIQSFTMNGTMKTAAECGQMKVIIGAKGDNSFNQAGQVTTSTSVLMPNKKRGEIDSAYTNGPYNGRTVKGIYKVEGGVVTFCYGAVGQERPTKFESTQANGQTLYTAKRAQK